MTLKTTTVFMVQNKQTYIKNKNKIFLQILTCI